MKQIPLEFRAHLIDAKANPPRLGSQPLGGLQLPKDKVSSSLAGKSHVPDNGVSAQAGAAPTNHASLRLPGPAVWVMLPSLDHYPFFIHVNLAMELVSLFFNF